MLILLADILGESVGSIFAAAFIPSLVLAGIYILYMLVLGLWKPHWVPAIPAEERAGSSGKQLLKDLARSCCRRWRWCSPCSVRSSAGWPHRPRPPRWARSAPCCWPPARAG